MTKKTEKKTKEVHVSFSENPTVQSAEHYVKMVGMKALNGCILLGPAGMGKTHTVRHILDEMGVDYTVLGGHISLEQTYKFLWENKDRIIFFDDVSQVINKTEIMEMLKQALNINQRTRVLHYRSKGSFGYIENIEDRPPEHFEFTGQIIFAFNLMDSSNMNVKAIMDRAPVVTLKFSRKEILQGMYKIAEGPSGELLQAEKLIVTREIENYTDVNMDISFRKQALAFRIFGAFQKMYGKGNMDWKKEVQKLFGKKKRHWLENLMIELVGTSDKLPKPELLKNIVLLKECSVRTAQRNIADGLATQMIYQNRKNGDISLKPFTLKKK